MKKFQFSLSRMLNYKEQVETAEKNKLAHCNLMKNQIDEHISTLNKEIRDLADTITKSTKSGLVGWELRRLTFQLDNNRQYLKQLLQELVAAEKAVEAQLNVVLGITQEVEGLKKLKERQYEEFLYEENKAEQLIVSEFVTAKLIRQNNVIDIKK